MPARKPVPREAPPPPRLTKRDALLRKHAGLLENMVIEAEKAFDNQSKERFDAAADHWDQVAELTKKVAEVSRKIAATPD